MSFEKKNGLYNIIRIAVEIIIIISIFASIVKGWTILSENQKQLQYQIDNNQNSQHAEIGQLRNEGCLPSRNNDRDIAVIQSKLDNIEKGIKRIEDTLTSKRLSIAPSFTEPYVDYE